MTTFYFSCDFCPLLVMSGFGPPVRLMEAIAFANSVTDASASFSCFDFFFVFVFMLFLSP